MDERKKIKKTLQGTVTNIIDETTIKVKVEKKSPHPKYGKIMARHKNYLVHNKKANLKNEKIEIGDIVSIEECRPISKRKSFLLIEKINS